MNERERQIRKELREFYEKPERPTCGLQLPTLADEPWPMVGIVAKLVEAADILLDEHSYDGHGWEEIEHCRTRAKQVLYEE